MGPPSTPIVPPESELTIGAHELVAASCPAHVVAHCERSYRFAVLLTQVDSIDVDAEGAVPRVRRNPDAVRLSWLEGIAVRHVDGYRAADFEAGLLDSSDFR
jgi:hypothetical protein